MVTGASKENRFVQARLRKLLAETGHRLFTSITEFPVTHGGLSQYPQHLPGTLPTGYWWLTRGERWNLHDHPDVPTEPIPHRRKEERRPVAGTFSVTAVGRVEEVPDRLALAMSRAANEDPKGRVVHMLFHIDARKDARLVFKVYHSKSKLAEHGPSRDLNGDVLEYLTEWPLQFVNLPDLAMADVEKKFVGRQRAAFYLVNGVVELKARADHVNVTLSLVKRGEVIRGKPRASQIFFAQTNELWDRDRSHIVSDSTGQPHQRRTDSPDLRGCTPAASHAKRTFDAIATDFETEAEQRPKMRSRHDMPRERSEYGLSANPYTADKRDSLRVRLAAAADYGEVSHAASSKSGCERSPASSDDDVAYGYSQPSLSRNRRGKLPDRR